jgi:hypothetical protein
MLIADVIPEERENKKDKSRFVKNKLENPEQHEKQLELWRLDYSKNVEKKRAQARKSYYKNIESKKKQAKIQREKHKDRVKNYADKWRESHREEAKEYSKDYYAKNKEKSLLDIALKWRDDDNCRSKRRVSRREHLRKNEDKRIENAAKIAALQEREKTDPEMRQRSMENKTERKKDYAERHRVENSNKLTKEETAKLKEKFLQVIEKAVYPRITAQQLEIDFSKVQYWLRTDPIFKERMELAQTRMAERIALAVVGKALNGNDLEAMKFFLKHQGKALGFSDERQNISVLNVNAIAENQDIANLSLDEQERMLELVRKMKKSEVVDVDFYDAD